MSKKSNKMFGCSNLDLIAHQKIDIMVYHNYVGMYCDIYPEQNGDTFSCKSRLQIFTMQIEWKGNDRHACLSSS
jgi:hypothetical protein